MTALPPGQEPPSQAASKVQVGSGPEVEAAGSFPDASQDLPMVVWIRGDEPHATDFFLEAEEVMQVLGIKRSRLTQISGKELRVGRRRMGRYIKPFYRESDVTAYKEWTRPTASHVKSRDLVDQALHGLQDLGAVIQGQMRDQLLAGIESLLQAGESSRSRSEIETRRQRKAASQIMLGQRQIMTWIQFLVEAQRHAGTQAADQALSLSKLQEAMRQQSRVQSENLLLTTNLTEMAAQLQAQLKEIAQQQTDLRELLEQEQQNLSKLTESLSCFQPTNHTGRFTFTTFGWGSALAAMTHRSKNAKKANNFGTSSSIQAKIFKQPKTLPS